MNDFTPANYFKLVFSIPEEYQELSTALVSSLPITGIEEMYDEQSFTFSESEWNDGAITITIEQLFQQADIPSTLLKTEKIVDQNWNKLWEESLEPVYVNDTIAISPTWKIHEVHHPIVAIINPQMSFGTGYHPTTRMVCKRLQEHVKKDSQWIDAGCGSGVLAIIAEKLGASSIMAFDNDEWSVNNTQENIGLNKSVNISVTKEDIFAVEIPSCDGIAANMYRNILIPNMHKFSKALENSKGILIMSGILKYDVDEIIDCAKKHHFDHLSTDIEGDWSAITMKAR